jgi:hypothetical protein
MWVPGGKRTFKELQKAGWIIKIDARNYLSESVLPRNHHAQGTR